MEYAEALVNEIVLSREEQVDVDITKLLKNLKTQTKLKEVKYGRTKKQRN